MNKSISIIVLLVFFIQIRAHVQAETESFHYNKNGSLVWISLTNGAVSNQGKLGCY
jgi:hypothetical protein